MGTADSVLEEMQTLPYRAGHLQTSGTCLVSSNLHEEFTVSNINPVHVLTLLQLIVLISACTVVYKWTLRSLGSTAGKLLHKKKSEFYN